MDGGRHVLLKSGHEEFKEGRLSARVSFGRVLCPLLAGDFVYVDTTSLVHLDFESDGPHFRKTKIIAGRMYGDNLFQSIRVRAYR